VSARFLADTNLVVDLLRHPEKLDQARFAAAGDAIAVSTVTLMELEFGVEASSDPARNRAEVDAILSRLAVLPFDGPAAQHVGQIRAHLKKRGEPIGPYDSLIAGHARSRGLILVTHNTGEFGRVPALQIEDWLKEPE
jgi:tRNA(fMet)-specific endonuclease VapC